MRKNICYPIALLSLVAMTAACSGKSERRIAATIDGQPVYGDVVDKAVEREIYESLCDIYDIRIRATRELIGIRLLDDEAKKNGITCSELIANYIERHNGDSLSAELARTLIIDSLASAHEIEIRLMPPVAPPARTDSASAHTRGRIGAKATLTVISDFDCGLCQTVHLTYSDLYDKYKDKVEFRHICFSDSVRPATLAAEAAGLQDAYWAMHDTLMRMHDVIDDKAAERLAAALGLDMEKFVHDYYSPSTAQTELRSFAYLSANGVDRTPMVLINNRPLRNPTDRAYIEKEIERAINE